MEPKLSTMTNFEHDTLKEIATIGAGNASRVLSHMTSQLVKVDVPRLMLLSIDKIAEVMGEAEELSTVVYLKIVGDVPGSILLVFSLSDANKLANFLSKDVNPNDSQPSGQNSATNEGGSSTLKEVGNIISGASLSALSTFTGLNLLQTIPAITTDMLRAIINTAIIELGEGADEALVLEMSLAITENGIHGKMYFLFNPHATQEILKATRAKISSVML